MDLDEIRWATHSIYRDSSPDFLRAVLSDALAELSPPRKWSSWLEESGTLQHLAECMAWVLDGEQTEGTYITPPDSLRDWLDHIVPAWGEMEHEEADAEWYEGLCKAFAVPAAMIEIGIRVESAVVEYDGNEGELFTDFIWETPSTDLALATLGESMRVGLLELPNTYRNLVGKSLKAWNQYPGGIDAFRYRVGAGEWQVVEL